MVGYFVNSLEPAVSIFASSAFCKLISFDRVNRDMFSSLIVRSKFVTAVMSGADKTHDDLDHLHPI